MLVTRVDTVVVPDAFEILEDPGRVRVLDIEIAIVGNIRDEFVPVEAKADLALVAVLFLFIGTERDEFRSVTPEELLHLIDTSVSVAAEDRRVRVAEHYFLRCFVVDVSEERAVRDIRLIRANLGSETFVYAHVLAIVAAGENVRFRCDRVERFVRAE